MTKRQPKFRNVRAHMLHTRLMVAVVPMPNRMLFTAHLREAMKRDRQEGEAGA